MDFQLKGRTAFVTGGSRGIGRAVALKLAEQGVNVAICGRTLDSLQATAADIRNFGVEAWPFQADVSKREDVERFAEQALTAAGGVDILVNNAVTSTAAPFDEQTDELFRYHIDVKLMAYIRLARIILPHLEKKGWGRIVNIGGMTARIVAPLRVTNGVVNAGVANFTKQLATRAAKAGVTINCVHPGFTATERVMQIFRREAEDKGVTLEEAMAERVTEIPLGRLIQPEDMANAVLFFCSPLAAMVTGQCIAVDGGSGESVNY
ncbi:MAG: short-chain dehydrogenase [Rhodospirillales bacterium CG15_BIG_FIL_POST_REV_8_21_14_020_66_15]|nr:MAG: short-chain dehydrogenase [Rhodospirillales bacterium CG15_BIG_FIL_POST_REV_8_21_14_020_66_15]